MNSDRDLRGYDERKSMIALELLKAKLEEREKLHGDYFRASSIILIVLGACLKFSTDESIHPDFRIVLPLAGLLITLVGLAEVWMGNRARGAIEAETAELVRRLDNTLPIGESLRLKYALIGFGCAGLIFLFGFVYVIVRSSW